MSGRRVRQFTVACADEQQAIALLEAGNPDLDVLSHHAIGREAVRAIGMTEGEILEWVALDCQEKLTGAPQTETRKAKQAQ